MVRAQGARARRRQSRGSASRLAWALLLLTSATLFLTSAPSAGAGPLKRVGARSPVEGGVYRRPLAHDPRTLDPARINDVYSRAVAQQIFDGLVGFDRTLATVPALAEFWEASRDGLTWTFTLRKGVKFHHGRELTADDVVFSLTRILDPRTRSGAADLFLGVAGAREFREGRAQAVAGLVALDRYTVRVSLVEARVPFVSVLAVGHAKIVPRDVVERQGEAFGSHPVGTGPFKFTRWERGREIVLAGNREYFGGPPHLSQIVFRVFPGAQFAAMYEEFAKGNLEDSPVPPGTDVGQAERGPYVYVKRPMISLRFYGLNTRTKPLDDRRVRQALLYAIDRESIIERLFHGRFTPARGILPPGTLGFNPRLRGYPFDPQRARELLAEAGYPDGRGLSPVVFWSSVKHDGVVREYEEIRRQLEAVGVPSEIRYLTDWPAYSRMLDEGQLPVFVYAWYADVPDPDNFLFKLFHSRSSRNFFGYASPAVDALLAAARAADDLTRRVELYRKVEQLVLDDAPIIPMMHHTYERLFQPYVRDVEVSGLGDPYIPLRKIWLERAR